MVCRPLEFGVELEELLHHGARRSLGAGSHALLHQGLALVGSLGDAGVVVLHLVQMLDVLPSAVRVVVVVAAEPVLEGDDVGDVDHEEGKDVLVVGFNELLHACIHLSSSHLLIGELLGMLTSDSRMELVVEEVGVQLVLVEVQNVPQVALELKELGPALVGELLGDNIFGVTGHDVVEAKGDAARWCGCGQSSGCQMPLFLGSVVVKVLWTVEVAAAVWKVSQMDTVSSNTETGYPTDLGKPYFDAQTTSERCRDRDPVHQNVKGLQSVGGGTAEEEDKMSHAVVWTRSKEEDKMSPAVVWTSRPPTLVAVLQSYSPTVLQLVVVVQGDLGSHASVSITA
eukprot:2921167-Pleurochrysis_carterae.AAC.1